MTRTKLNKKAWDSLKENERMALSLQLGMEKSTWEAGEIMGKSHYKYLEIRHRAQKFLQMYTEHLEIYDRVIPDWIITDHFARKYFQHCIEKRMTPAEALNELQKELGSKVLKSDLNARILKSILILEKSPENLEFKTIYNFIKEFDRWNNFRILPREIQEPSAFKRRQKNVNKRHIKLLNSIPDISLKKLRQLYETKRKPCYYLPLINNGLPEIIQIRTTKGCFETMVDINFYIFKDRESANKFIQPVMHYLLNPDRSCRDGLEFWPLYRELIKEAINYKDILNIVPSRKHLELALQKLTYL